MRLSRVLPLALSAALLVLASCDGGGGSDNGTDVAVTLRQFTITLDRSVSSDSRVTFDVTNAGTVTHEFVIVKTDLAPGSLPTEANGSYAENGTGTVVIDEIADLQPGDNQRITVNLAAGNYVLLCNMVGPAGAHYALGMRTSFTVS